VAILGADSAESGHSRDDSDSTLSEVVAYNTLFDDVGNDDVGGDEEEEDEDKEVVAVCVCVDLVSRGKRVVCRTSGLSSSPARTPPPPRHLITKLKGSTESHFCTP
jgi:hypothetical protein